MLVCGIVVAVVGASLLLFIFTFAARNSHLSKTRGILFIFLYLVYIVYLIA
jgi:quinol-cytochrome oxidoreductase complex cytochrome b subunit